LRFGADRGDVLFGGSLPATKVLGICLHCCWSDYQRTRLMKKNQRNIILPMKPSYAGATSIGIVAVVVAVAWLFFSPVYDTNDDVGIRLFLEGRIVPGATPSGHIDFFNLALGQALAWLYLHVPGPSWYDVAEQGTLVVTASVALYCCLRVVRLPEEAIAIAFIAAAIFTTMVVVQFTIVAMLTTMVGTAGFIVALALPTSNFERLLLSSAGAFLVIVGTLFRWEAAVFGVTTVAVIALPTLVDTFRLRRTAGVRITVVFIVTALLICGLAWTYHFAEYFQSAAWRTFFLFDRRRAEIAEYAARFPLPVLNDAFAAVGWTLSDYAMMKEWLFFDPAIFSLEKLNAIVARLPVLTNPGIFPLADLLSSYVRAFPFTLIAIAGVVFTAPRVKVAIRCVLSLATIAIIAAAVSFFLKPLPYHVFWPLAVGTIFAMWIVIRLDRPTMPHWTLRAASAALIATASTMMIAQTIEKVRSAAYVRQLVLSDLARIGPEDLVVLVGGAFPYEGLEHPFGPPYLQRTFQALPLGASQTAPPVANFIHKVALPDLATWLCSNSVILVARPSALAALASYYRERRGASIRFSTLFSGNTFSAFRCNMTVR
jgi:hypothetical protein